MERAPALQTESPEILARAYFRSYITRERLVKNAAQDVSEIILPKTAAEVLEFKRHLETVGGTLTATGYRDGKLFLRLLDPDTIKLLLDTATEESPELEKAPESDNVPVEIATSETSTPAAIDADINEFRDVARLDWSPDDLERYEDGLKEYIPGLDDPRESDTLDALQESAYRFFRGETIEPAEETQPKKYDSGRYANNKLFKQYYHWNDGVLSDRDGNIINRPEHIDLLIAAKEDDRALETACRIHEGLVQFVAHDRKFDIRTNHRITMDDLLQAGRTALFQAIRRLDIPDNPKDTTYISYFVKSIEGSMRNELRKRSVVPIPDSHTTEQISLIREERRQEDAGNSSFDSEEAAEHTNINLAKVKQLYRVLTTTAEPYDDEDATHQQDHYRPEHESFPPDTLDVLDEHEVAREVSKILLALTPREERVLRKRFFQECTLEEIGKEFNVSRGRIGEIEDKALRKLAHPGRIRKLERLLGLPHNQEARTDWNL